MSNRIKQSIKLKRPKAGKLVGFIGAAVVLAIGVYCSITLCSCESGTSVSADIDDLSNLTQAVIDDTSASGNANSISESQTVQNLLESDTEQDDKYVTVFVCGAVNSPGVYEFEADSRVVDALEMAGGFTPEACVEYLNQAEKLIDSVRIYVPTLEEVQNGTVPYSETSLNSSDGYSKQNTVNINTADKELLMTLPGIGEAKAGSIIKYRNSKGAFSSVEEIKNVEGIKDGIFEGLKDLICV